MADLKQYAVTLHSYKELEDFYQDMETPGGSLYIPDRMIEVFDRRAISRTTNYMLSVAEAEEVSKDPRILSVEDLDLRAPPEVDDFKGPSVSLEPPPETEGTGSTSSGDVYSKWQSWYANSINWGAVEHTYDNPQNNSSWGALDVFSAGDPNSANFAHQWPVSYNGTGKNVDVIVFDGGIVVKDHPEFAVNRDGTGGSRVVEYNWYAYTGGTYDYSQSPNYHATHVAGTVAGGRYGWAYDANIYTIGYNDTNVIDAIRHFHNNKAVNPETGRKNPTIVNMSWGAGWRMGKYESLGYAQYGFYKGNSVSPSTRAEYLDQIKMMNESGTTDSDAVYYMGDWSDSLNADYTDAMNEGIIFVSSAGNSKNLMCNYLDSDWNNYVFCSYLGGNYPFRTHRPGTPKYPGTIVVGALDVTQSPRSADFSTRGPYVDVYAAGVSVVSSYTSNGTVNDPRNSSYKIGNLGGTSMASPQVAGVLACALELWPNMTPSEAREWIKSNTRDGVIRDYSYASSDASAVYSLAGANNSILYFKPIRELSGNSFPEKRYKPRSTSGSVYPRTKIRRRG